MDAVTDRHAEVIVIMTSSQVGKTEALNNVIGYFIDQQPAPMLLVQPTVELAEAWSKDRVAPMLRDTPALRGKVADARSRDSGNTVRHKTFVGGHMTFAGANSPAGLAARPIRIVLLDEVDRYPASAGEEGDPVSLATKRTTTFWNRKIILTSTPTTRGVSRIEKEWGLSDKRLYHVPCQHCSEAQVLRWQQVKWPSGKPELAAYHCEHCGVEWSEADRNRSVLEGEWRASERGNGKTAGFRLNELYSPWSTPATMAQAWLDAQGNPEKLKTFINTALGELWEEDAERVDADTLEGRAEKPETDWAEVAPAGVLIVTMGVDVQADRIEVERVGWGFRDESWSLEQKVIFGDPTGDEIWRELDEYTRERTVTADGRRLSTACVCVDHGYLSAQVSKFVRPREKRRVFAVKGVGGPGVSAWPKLPSRKNAGKVQLFRIGVDAIKDTVRKRFSYTRVGPGYCHFPKDRGKEYFAQLTSERVERVYKRGFPVRVYVKDEGVRNEALDCRVYATAALLALNVNWGKVMRRSGRVAEVDAAPVNATPAEPAAQPQPEAKAERPTQARRRGRVRRRSRVGGASRAARL